MFGPLQRGLTACVLAVFTIFSAGTASAASRGLSVQVRADEKPNSPVAETVRLYGSSHALVVGIDNYNSGWPRLSNAIKDAELVAAALRERGFDVTLALDLDADALEEAFETFFIDKGTDPEARLFVWYAGHGHTEAGEGFLVPADAPLPSVGAKFRRKALSMRRFGEYVRLAQSKHAFAVFDSCFAGTIFEGARALPPPTITRATTRPVRAFLSSGDADQQVTDDGTFRQLFIEALEGKRPADANRDGYLTSSELGMFMSDSISNYTRNFQTPRFGKLRDPRYDAGDFVFQMASLEVVPPNQLQSQTDQGQATQSTRSLELAFWNSVKDSNNPASYEAYLTQFPNGTFAELARLKIANLKGEQSAALTPPSQPAGGFQVETLDESRFAITAANVRSGPDTSQVKLLQLEPGQEVNVTGKVKNKNWLRVALADGRTGYVYAKTISGPFVAPQNSPAPQTAQQPAPQPAPETRANNEPTVSVGVGAGGGSGGGIFSIFGGIGQGLANLTQPNAVTVRDASGSYDGRWRGEAVMMTGRCKARFPIEITVTGGKVEGTMIIGSTKHRTMWGSISPTGRIDMRGDEWTVTTFSGSASAEAMNGIWDTPQISVTNPGCHGRYKLTRVLD